MNQVTLNTITMTSLEMVDLINAERRQIEVEGGKAFVKLEHRDFMKKVRTVLGEEGVRKFSHTHINPQNGQSYPIFCLPKREAMLLAMSYSYPMQARVYDHMTMLEDELRKASEPSAPAIPTTFAEALRLAADKAEQVERLSVEVAEKEEQLVIAAPKVEFHDAVTEASNSHTIEQAAKILGTGRNKLFKILRDNGILRSNNLPYQTQIDNGNFKVVETVWRNPHTEEVKINAQTLVTGKGLVYIQKRNFIF